MKKLKFLLFFLLAIATALATCSCTDINALLGQFGLGTHVCADANGDTACDTCGAYVAPAACTAHIDNNNDGVCDNSGCGASVLMEMLDVVFNDRSVTYDGNPKTVEVKGAPDGAKIVYSMANTQTNAGKYEITATITADGYADCELTATLTIKQRSLTINWGEDIEGPFPSNGKTPEIDYTLDGVISGETVEVNFDFGDCDFTKEGWFDVTATSKNPNYQIKTAGGANVADFLVGPNSHTVTFVTGFENKTISPEEVADGETVDKPSLSILGYNLLGWYNGEEEWDFETPVTKGMTLTAKWQTIEYNIDYYLYGGTNAAGNPTVYTVESGIDLSVPTRDGYVFLGWYEDSTYQTPLSKTEPGDRVKDVSLYARWSSTEYTEVISGSSVDDSFILDSYLADGIFRYTFVANIESFADNGAIYVGRGKDTADGRYVKLTADSVTVCTNGSSPITESKAHIHAIEGYVIIDVVANKGHASVTVRTSDGEFYGYYDFSGKNGEIFASTENAVLKDAKLAWSTDEYEEPVWILADSDTSYTNDKSWASEIYKGGIVDALLMSAAGVDSSAALKAFEDALLTATPKYALWSFDKESGSAYDANLASFISICKDKGITPVLTTQLVAVSSDNEAKNAAVTESGEKYVDFASLESSEGLYSGGYTELGVDALYAKLLLDFPEIITPTTPVEKVTAEKLDSENNTLVVAENKVKDGKVMIFTAKIDGELGADEKIIIGHGYGSSYSAWTEINGTQTVSYSQGADTSKDPSSTKGIHNLTIKNYITVIMVQDTADGLGYKLTLVTDGGSYTRSLRGNPCNGKLAVTVEGATLTDAELSYTSINYSAPIWIFGASYFSLGDPARWPYYMYADGYTDEILMVGRGGLNTTGGLVELKDALRYATPEYIIWGYGMNDGSDSDGVMKQVTYDNHIEFLEICKQNNIKAIFMSSVNCTTNIHDGKIDYVANRLGRFADYDYRVISLPHAVNGYEVGSEWYDGMLSGDGIHPTKLGARNFYLETLCTFPELMIGWDSDVVKAEADKLASNTKLTIDTPEYVDGDFAITFNADFDGSLRGAIEIGNGKESEGGTWVRITEDKVEVYRNISGEAVLVKETDNVILMEELIMLRIHVKDNIAKISFVSSGDELADGSALFTVEVAWSYAGGVYAVADSTPLTDASLKFVTE